MIYDDVSHLCHVRVSSLSVISFSPPLWLFLGCSPIACTRLRNTYLTIQCSTMQITLRCMQNTLQYNTAQYNKTQRNKLIAEWLFMKPKQRTPLMSSPACNAAILNLAPPCCLQASPQGNRHGAALTSAPWRAIESRGNGTTTGA